jgi:4-methyl-5(b-hydroxyethyl)-thiazole monophosphate biosynthesis
MAKALVLLAQGFEEIEAVTIVDVLRRADIVVTLAGLDETSVRGSHGIVVDADATLDAIALHGFDALALPGGMPGAKNLREDERVLALVRAFVHEGKLVGAICAGPTVLEAAGVLHERRATGYPGHALPSARYSEDRVVEDGNIVTSRAAGTAMEFALTLVRRLLGTQVAETERERLLA